MGSFVGTIIKSEKIYNSDFILKNGDVYFEIIDFLFDLVDYFYIKVDRKESLEEKEIDNFVTYINKYKGFIELKKMNDFCSMLNKLSKRINEIIRTKDKKEQIKLKKIVQFSVGFLEFGSYDSKKEDLEMIEKGHTLDRLIFDERNECIFDMLRKDKKIYNFKYTNGQLLVDKVFNFYKNVLDNNYDSSIRYYNRLLFCLIDCYKKNSSKDILLEYSTKLRELKNKINSKEKSSAIYSLLNNLEILELDKINDNKFNELSKHLCKNYNVTSNFSSHIETKEDLKYTRKNDVVDYRDKNIITMDSSFKTAYDDAVSFEVLDDGYLLGIYITDVASYVGLNTLLYEHAYQRVESIYSENCNRFYYPMFPLELTRDFFSLNKNQDKYVVAHMFKFSFDYELISCKFENALIRVKNNYSFDNVDRMRDNDKDYKMINGLKELSDNLIFGFNPNYHALKESKHSKTRNSKYANNLSSLTISNLTLFLNSFIAELFSKGKMPFIYRVNESIVPIDKSYFSDMDSILKYYNFSRYSSDPIGHAGNNMKVYGHITKPIRSYASYINQYLFEYLYLDEDTFDNKSKFINEWKLQLPKIVSYINDKLDSNRDFACVYDKLYDKRLTKKK